VHAVVASALAISITYPWEATRLTLIPQYLVVGVLYLLALRILREIRPGDIDRLTSIHAGFEHIKKFL